MQESQSPLAGDICGEHAAFSVAACNDESTRCGERIGCWLIDSFLFTMFTLLFTIRIHSQRHIHVIWRFPVLKQIKNEIDTRLRVLFDRILSQFL